MKKLCVFLSVISAFVTLLCLTYYSNLQNVVVDGDGIGLNLFFLQLEILNEEIPVYAGKFFKGAIFSGLAALGLGFFGLKKGRVV